MFIYDFLKIKCLKITAPLLRSHLITLNACLILGTGFAADGPGGASVGQRPVAVHGVGEGGAVPLVSVLTG